MDKKIELMLKNECPQCKSTRGDICSFLPVLKQDGTMEIDLVCDNCGCEARFFVQINNSERARCLKAVDDEPEWSPMGREHLQAVANAKKNIRKRIDAALTHAESLRKDLYERYDPVCRKCGDPLTTEELICDTCRKVKT